MRQVAYWRELCSCVTCNKFNHFALFLHSRNTESLLLFVWIFVMALIFAQNGQETSESFTIEGRFPRSLLGSHSAILGCFRWLILLQFLGMQSVFMALHLLPPSVHLFLLSLMNDSWSMFIVLGHVQRQRCVVSWHSQTISGAKLGLPMGQSPCPCTYLIS